MARITERWLWRGGLLGAALLALGACGTGPNERIGAVAGGAAGGLAGAQIGDGRGQLAATAVGAGLGALLGAEAGRRVDAANRTGPRYGRPGPGPYYRDPYSPEPGPGVDTYGAHDRPYGGDPWRADARGDDGARWHHDRERWQYGPRRSVVRAAPRIVADPTRQVPIPGAKVPGGGLGAWLPDLGPAPAIRNAGVPADPAADPACSPIDQPTLKPAYSCRVNGVSFVVQ